MTRNVLKATIPAMLAASLQAACTPADEQVPGRWYTQSQVERGQTIFMAHCARCHGNRAQGTRDWREPDFRGKYPPPPLNGSAHAWHHPLPVLLRVIEKGGIPLGGVMPGFAQTLDPDQIRDTIAFFQNFWPDEIYARWSEINEG